MYIINPKIDKDQTFVIFVPKESGRRLSVTPSKLDPSEYEKYFRLGFRGVFIEVEMEPVVAELDLNLSDTFGIPDLSDLLGEKEDSIETTEGINQDEGDKEDEGDNKNSEPVEPKSYADVSPFPSRKKEQPSESTKVSEEIKDELPTAVTVLEDGQENIYILKALSYDEILALAKRLGFTYVRKQSKSRLLNDIVSKAI